MLARPEVQYLTSTASPARLRWCSQVASASASDSLNCAVSGASSGRGEGRKIKDALLARETVEQLDDFAGRVKAKRVEFAPRTTLSSLAERLNDGRLRSSLSRLAAPPHPAAGVRSGWATVPRGRFCRQRFLRRGNPACGSIRNCGGARKDCKTYSRDMSRHLMPIHFEAEVASTRSRAANSRRKRAMLDSMRSM